MHRKEMSFWNPLWLEMKHGFFTTLLNPSNHLLRWEIVWRKARRIWRDFGSALPFQTRLNQTKPVLPLSNEHGSQLKDQDRWQCCHNKHKNFPYRPTRDVSLLSGHASYDLHLLTAIGLTPGGSSTINIYTQTIHITTQLSRKFEKIISSDEDSHHKRQDTSLKPLRTPKMVFICYPLKLKF